MGLVKYALKFRVTFYVLAILILLAGIGSYVVMPKDVLPNVDIPVATIVWTYTGFDTPDMGPRLLRHMFRWLQAGFLHLTASELRQ